MKVRTTILVALLITLFSLPGCVEKIDIQPPSGLSNSLVVLGRVVLGEPTRIEAEVSRLFSFNSETRGGVSVKSVHLFDDKGNRMLLRQRDLGKFFTILEESDPIQVEIGGSYGLEVLTFEDQLFVSQLDILQDNHVIEGIDFELVERSVENALGDLEEELKILVSIDTKFSNNEGKLWELNSTYKLTDSPPSKDPKSCYITSVVDVNKLPVLKSESDKVNDINELPLFELPIDFRMAEGMYIQISQYSLSPESTKFWEQSSFLVEREGGLFDKPVGLISSNFTNVNNPDEEVFGYFYSTKEEVVRVKVPSDLIGNIKLPCPPIVRPNSVPICPTTICCDCLDAPISTTEKPDYWID